MTEDTSKRTPPYIPYKTFDNFIKGLEDTGVPHKIDGSLLRNMSGSTRSGLMVALRYLGLVDENDNIRPALEKLVDSDSEGRKAQLKSLMSASYGFLSTLDLKRATPAQLADAIGQEGASGGTRDKAVSFFLRVAEDAGIEISAHILKRKHAVSGLRRVKRLPIKRKGGSESKTPSKPPAMPQGTTTKTPYEVLMHDIYDPAAMQPGSEEEKAVFTLARFLKSREAGA
jgi:hypothetical protein